MNTVRLIALTNLMVISMLGAEESQYRESLRPQYHFTAPKGWLNDPNGLVFHAGDYHLFYQHNPTGTWWTNELSWGHAISKDLVRWQHHEPKIPPAAILPGKIAGSWSGTAIVDSKNTAKFRSGTNDPLVIAWTATGVGQCLAYSNDRGRTWSTYEKNPVLPIPEGQKGDWDRDPKLLWHEPTQRWIMVLSITGKGFDFFSSENLKEWNYLSTFKGLFECPEFFEMAVQKDLSVRRWILWDASSKYFIGRFDGTNFSPEAGPHFLDLGKNYYAAQTWSDVPGNDERRIGIAWMREGKYPGMPFNQQMTVPFEVVLRRGHAQLVLCKSPVAALTGLRQEASPLKNFELLPGTNLLSGIQATPVDVEISFGVQRDSILEFTVAGQQARWAENKFTVGNRLVMTGPVEGQITFRILVDRTSVELFVNGGMASMSSCMLPDDRVGVISCRAVTRPVRVRSMTIHPLRTIWD